MPGPELDLLSLTGSITAPAGCGKTELIADAVTRYTGTKPILVLTHTNAGVAALRGRFNRAQVPSSHYKLATIDGFAIRLLSTFPMRAGHDQAILKLDNPGSDYPEIQRTAARLVHSEHVNDVLAATYSRLLIDEYQDCSLEQHRFATGLSGVLPTCVLGDPLQAVFGFRGSQVDWPTHVCEAFAPAGELATPWRWINAGEERFGRWLLQDVRQQLLRGQPIDLRTAPNNVTYTRLTGADDHRLRLTACLTPAPTQDGCVLIIASTRPVDQRRYASQTPGAVVAENVDMRDLVDFARVFDIRSAGALDALVKFAGTVMTNVGADDLLNRVRVLKSGGARKPASDVEIAAINFDARPSYREAASLLDAINDMGGVRAHRPAILRGCYRMLLMCDVPNGPTPLDAATEVREQARLIGRPLSRQTVGSTLLLKGLEGDLSVILNPELMDSQHLYVAMTRGARGLVICSSSPVLNAA